MIGMKFKGISLDPLKPPVYHDTKINFDDREVTLYDVEALDRIPVYKYLLEEFNKRGLS